MMMRGRNFISIGIALCLVVAAAVVAAKGKGPGSGAPAGNAKPKVKISAQYANFPLPYAAELVPGNKQKAAKGWTEYRVLGFSLDSLTLFYRTNMPGHGWKLGHYKGNTWTWRRGNRTVVVVYVRISIFCLIQIGRAHV